MLNVTDSLETMDYFSDNTRESSQLQALFFGEGRSDIQKFSGFTIGSGESTNASYPKSEMKGIVVEIYFGKTAEESYFRINGQNCGSPSAVPERFFGRRCIRRLVLQRHQGRIQLQGEQQRQRGSGHCARR